MLRRFRRLILRELTHCKFLALCCVIGVGLIYFINLHNCKVNYQIIEIPHKTTESDKCVVSCPRNQFSFYIKSGEGINSFPIICFNNKEYVSGRLKNVHRGINGVFIDGKTKQVITVKHFDTHVEDFNITRYLKRKLPEEAVIILTSHGDVALSLYDSSRKLLKEYGGDLISQVNFHDKFIFVGQRGLKSRLAIEFLRKNSEGAGHIEKSGCFNIPMGPLQPVTAENPEILTGGNILHRANITSCHMKKTCGIDSFPVSLFTGTKNLEYPEICVDKHMFMAKGLNHAGRGMNVVTYDPRQKKVLYVANFDTYKEDSIPLEIFLDELPKHYILIIIVFDDASRNLNQHARQLFQQFGSSMIENLKYRDVWYFIGQKTIQSYSKFEMISYAKPDSGWPNSMQLSACVPYKMTGTRVPPEPLYYRNDKRRHLCNMFQEWTSFCDVSHVDDFIKPVPLVYKRFKGHKIFSTPIVVIPGIDHVAAINTFQTIIMQNGINPEMVLVCWDEKFPEYYELAELFGFQNKVLPSSYIYNDVMMKAIDMAWTVFPDNNYVIFIEEELLLSPDFLFFMAQSMSLLEQDSSVFAISAWNYNGYETSKNSSLLYRVEDFPGLGFMLKKQVYMENMRGTMEYCCKNDVWEGWNVLQFNPGEIIIPDVPRVYRQSSFNFPIDLEFINAMFKPDRVTELYDIVKRLNFMSVKSSEYEISIMTLLLSSHVLPESFFTNYFKMNTSQKLPIKFPANKQYYSVFYEQRHPTDFSVLATIIKCFGMTLPTNRRPYGLHKGLLRLNHQGKQIAFVGQHSYYFYLKPSDSPAISRQGLGKAPQ